MKFDSSESPHFLSNENNDDNHIFTFSRNQSQFETDEESRRPVHTDASDSTSNSNKRSQSVRSIFNKSKNIFKYFYKIKVFWLLIFV